MGYNGAPGAVFRVEAGLVSFYCVEVEEGAGNRLSVAYVRMSIAPEGGSSPPYKGSGLGLGFTRMLQVYPYDIIYGAGRLQLDHHDVWM